MKCNHCNKTIPEVSISCPFCKNVVDVNAKPSVDFGTLDVTDYDNKFDIKTYVQEPKNKKKVILFGSLISGGVLLLIVIIIAIFLALNTEPSGYTLFNATVNELYEFVINNYTGSSSTKSGEYNLQLKINDDQYEFNGNYGLDVNNKILSLTGKLEDPKKNEGGIIIDSKVLQFDAYLKNNAIYLLSEQIYNPESYILLPINDETGLLETKKYDIESLINGIYDAVDAGLKKMTYNKSEESIVHRGERIDVSRYHIILDNKAKKIFMLEFYNALLEDTNFINEYARINDTNSTEIERIINNYITSVEYKYSGDSKDKTILSLYYKDKKVYRLEIVEDAKVKKTIQLDIGDTKYYFNYFEGEKNIYSGTLVALKSEKKDYTLKEYEITFDSDKALTDISLTIKDSYEASIKKKDITKFVSIEDFKENDFNIVKNNLSNYFYDVRWVDKLDDIFVNKCNTSLSCKCEDGAKVCNCTYNNTIIECPIESVTAK